MAAYATFQAFGASHLAMLAVFVIGIPLVVLLGRRVRGTPYEQRVSRGYALAVPAITVPLQVIDFLPGQYDLHTTLPLQLCDVAWVVAVIALWSQNHTATTITYLWGVVLTSQALLTPALASDFPHPKFLAFWAMHLLVVWAAAYLTLGLGIRPDWRGLRRTIAATLVWLVVVFIVNALLGTNYGFVNSKPSTGSILDLLGPWPWYLLVESALVLAVWALLTWPWVRRPANEPSSVSG